MDETPRPTQAKPTRWQWLTYVLIVAGSLVGISISERLDRATGLRVGIAMLVATVGVIVLTVWLSKRKTKSG
jgi:uncharacterized membrane-anchored protein